MHIPLLKSAQWLCRIGITSTSGKEAETATSPRQGHLMIWEDYGGPDAPFDGKENVIEGIFRKLEAINSQLIANVG